MRTSHEDRPYHRPAMPQIRARRFISGLKISPHQKPKSAVLPKKKHFQTHQFLQSIIHNRSIKLHLLSTSIVMMNNTVSPKIMVVARQADASYQFEVVISIIGVILVFGLAMAYFYLFYLIHPRQRGHPEPPRGRTQVRASEDGTELSDLSSASRR
ncbi:hypothetical protein F4859DRAFT_518966 [Xylaria cf. heliscus]|nr:hypothetical protein F4859DRAFT_518966 [Xylaria cf. heliscus]